jgi:peptidoglycan/xylan/chitin deacetylase (PgdA/CDA1 family)
LALGVAGVAGGAAAGFLYAVFYPRATVFGPVISSGPRARKAVALTFDDGPHPKYTPRIAEAVAKRGGRATFFCVGREVDKHRALTRELFQAGHQLENHTYRHGLGADLFLGRRLGEDLGRCQQALAAVTGTLPRYFRPAVGVRNPAVHAAARAHALTVVTWSHAARDGVFDLTAARARALGRATRAGDILTLHDGTISVPDSRRDATLAQLPVLLDELCGAGYALVTLDELLAGG